jgi:D-tyrosyl-tRNA(Tyr) deacylase
MLGLIQRVSSASVTIDDAEIAKIDQGIALLLGIQKNDTKNDVEKLLIKTLKYRIFADLDGKMNQSLSDIAGELLIVSQFTLAADTTKGLRPGFSSAAPPDQAESLYDYFLSLAKDKHPIVQHGQFGANMNVTLTNDGPVTFMLQS